MKKRNKSFLFSLILSFILGSYNGYIALWEGMDPEPIRIFPYKTTSLPAADQAALEKGIEIDSMEKLVKMLEDYLS